MTRRRLLYAGPFIESLELTLDMQPFELRQLSISNEPAAVWSHDHLPTNYLLSRNLGVSVTTDRNDGSTALSAKIRSSSESAEILIFPPTGRQVREVSLDGKSVVPTWVV